MGKTKRNNTRTRNKRKRKFIALGLLGACIAGAIAIIPTKEEKTIKNINRDINNKVLRVENIIENTEVYFDKDNKELEVSIEINPIEEDVVRGKKPKDLVLYQSKDLAKYTLKELNNIVSDKAGVKLKKANEDYLGELYDHYSTTIKVYRRGGHIYSYAMIENGEMREIN